MYIWKEAIHGNSHADQDVDNRAWHAYKAHFRREWSFAVKLERNRHNLRCFLLMYSRQRRCDVENLIAVYKSVLSNASELLRSLSGQLPCVNALAK